jgi:hypothetical protein
MRGNRVLANNFMDFGGARTRWVHGGIGSALAGSLIQDHLVAETVRTGSALQPVAFASASSSRAAAVPGVVTQFFPQRRRTIREIRTTVACRRTLSVSR